MILAGLLLVDYKIEILHPYVFIHSESGEETLEAIEDIGIEEFDLTEWEEDESNVESEVRHMDTTDPDVTIEDNTLCHDSDVDVLRSNTGILHNL